MPAPSYTVAADWNGNGSFADPGDDISGDTLDTSTVTIRYGRDQSRSLAPASGGTAAFQIDNATRAYSPDNAASPLAPSVLPARPVMITAMTGGGSAVYASTYAGTYGGGTPYVLYRGFFDTYDVSSEDHTVAVGATDALARLSAVTLSTPLSFSVTTGQAAGLILDAAGWPPALRDVDQGATMIRWWWEEGTDGLTALQKIIASEGPPAIAYLDPGTGNFVFRDRTHRLTRTASVTSQATWADSGPEPVFSAPFSYDLGWRDIVNTLTLNVDERSPAGSPSVVWKGAGIITVADGQTVAVTAQGSDPFISAQIPVAGTGFNLQSGVITVALSRTSGQSTLILLTSPVGSGGAVLDTLSLTATPVPVTSAVQVTATDSASVMLYGQRALATGLPVWSNQNDTAAIAQIILAQRATRLPVISVTFDGLGSAVVQAQQLTRALSDRVTVTEYETGLTAADFFVEQVQHAISSGGGRLLTTFGCEKAPLQPVSQFTFDDAVLGKFDAGRFGASGLSNPATVFKFDDGALGKFDSGGVFAY